MIRLELSDLAASRAHYLNLLSTVIIDDQKVCIAQLNFICELQTWLR